MRLAVLALFSLAACKHGTGLELDVRNSNSTARARAFEWNPQTRSLDALGPQGRVLQLWVHPGRLQVVGESDVTVPEGCRGGYLTQYAGGASNLIEVILCPAPAPAEGWQGWHADFYVYGDAAVTSSFPPKLDFGWRPGGGNTLEIAGRSFRARLAVPAGQQGDLVLAFPELVAFSLVTGVVPLATDGQYEVVAR